MTVTPSSWTFLVATCVVLAWLALRSAAHLVTGDLYTAMIVHVLCSVVAGVVLLRLARCERLLPSSPCRATTTPRKEERWNFPT